MKTIKQLIGRIFLNLNNPLFCICKIKVQQAHLKAAGVLSAFSNKSKLTNEKQAWIIAAKEKKVKKISFENEQLNLIKEQEQNGSVKMLNEPEEDAWNDL